MTIKLTNIKYDLYDAETNPSDDLTNEDLDLPNELVIEQKTIDELFEGDFDLQRDLSELIRCLTGFDAVSHDVAI